MISAMGASAINARSPTVLMQTSCWGLGDTHPALSRPEAGLFTHVTTIIPKQGGARDAGHLDEVEQNAINMAATPQSVQTIHQGLDEGTPAPQIRYFVETSPLHRLTWLLTTVFHRLFHAKMYTDSLTKGTLEKNILFYNKKGGA